MSLHAFTHCDTSTFKGIGKIRPIKLLLKNKGFQDALSKLVDTWEVPAELNNKLEESQPLCMAEACTRVSMQYV